MLLKNTVQMRSAGISMWTALRINEAENILLDGIDYSNRDEVIAAALFYQHLSEKDSEFLERDVYKRQGQTDPENGGDNE